jgi:hypothetical protein
LIPDGGEHLLHSAASAAEFAAEDIAGHALGGGQRRQARQAAGNGSPAGASAHRSAASCTPPCSHASTIISNQAVAATLESAPSGQVAAEPVQRADAVAIDVAQGRVLQQPSLLVLGSARRSSAIRRSGDRSCRSVEPASSARVRLGRAHAFGRRTAARQPGCCNFEHRAAALAWRRWLALLAVPSPRGGDRRHVDANTAARRSPARRGSSWNSSKALRSPRALA